MIEFLGGYFGGALAGVATIGGLALFIRMVDSHFRRFRRIAWMRPRDRVTGYRPVAWPGLRAARICEICYGNSARLCPKCEKRGHSLDRPKRDQPAKCPRCRLSTGCICARDKAHG